MANEKPKADEDHPLTEEQREFRATLSVPITIEELREVSNLAGDVLSAMFELDIAADIWRQSQDDAHARRFIKHLHECEDAANALNDAWYCKPQEAFAAVNSTQVQEIGLAPAASAHGDIANGGALLVGEVAYAVVKKGLPELYEPGMEYEYPQLVTEAELLEHFQTAMRAYLTYRPPSEKLKAVSVMLQQERGRAIAALPVATFATPKSKFQMEFRWNFPSKDSKQKRDRDFFALRMNPVHSKKDDRTVASEILSADYGSNQKQLELEIDRMIDRCRKQLDKYPPT